MTPCQKYLMTVLFHSAKCLSIDNKQEKYKNKQGGTFMNPNPVYLDCNATTPIEPEVYDTICHYLKEEYGNAASRTHVWGAVANKAVLTAREKIAEVIGAKTEEVIFTSGATESNNIALLGLVDHGEKTGKRHIITSGIEHKAVLEPLDAMVKRGFDISYVSVGQDGRVQPEQIKEMLRDDTLIVSIMHVNNETGVVQPLKHICEILSGHEAFFHTDAAQGFGKDIEALWNPRIDLISVSGHKIFSAKGVGALIARRRGYKKAPLSPILFGGGQERGLRPGTLPVHLIAGFGKAAQIALTDATERQFVCLKKREEALRALLPIGGVMNGDEKNILPHVLNISFPGLDSEAAIVALKDVISISNGSACTSQNYSPSHVLLEMGLGNWRIKSALRISWCHLTPSVDWSEVARRIKSLCEGG